MAYFSDPPREHYPLICWLWNGPLLDPDPASPLRWLREAGFGGVIITGCPAGPAFEADQLCPASDAAREAGLEVWLEPASQSPPAPVGHVLEVQVVDVPADLTSHWHYPAGRGSLVYALAAPLSGPNGGPDFDHAAFLTKGPPHRVPVLLEGLAAAARVYLFWMVPAAGPETLDPAAAASLVQPFADALRGLEPGAVQGVMAAAPPLPLAAQDAPVAFSWTPALPHVFSETQGYGLLDWLPGLIADTGAETVRMRQDYWRTLQSLLEHGFWKPIETLALSAGLQTSGHLEAQRPLNRSVAAHGDAVSVYRRLSRPAVEVPGLEAATSYLGRGPGLAARLCSSVAMLEGKPQALAETWNRCGWDATLGSRTASANALLAQGINRFAVHSALANIRGRRKTDGPTSELHQPYRVQWAQFNSYLARCCYSLSLGRPGTQVGLLWPERSAVAHFNPAGHRLTRWVEEDLYATAVLLDEAHFDYLIVPEADLCAARIEGAALLCGKAALPLAMLVLPSITTLSNAAWQVLESFVEGGGKVVCLGLLPRWSERGRDGELESRVSRSAGIQVGDLYEGYTALEGAGLAGGTTIGYPVARENAAGGRWSCYQPRLNPDPDDAFLRVRKLLKESLSPRLETQSAQILFNHRVLGRADRLAGRPSIVAVAEEPTADAPPPVAEIAPPPVSDEFAWDKDFEWDAEQATRPPEQEPAAEEVPPPPDPGPEAEEEPAPLMVAEAVAPEVELAGGDIFFVVNTASSPQQINVRLRPGTEGAPYELDAWTGAIKPLPVWMSFPAEEGGGLSLAMSLAAAEAKLVWIRPQAPGVAPPPHLERVTFTAETFAGGIAGGYATEPGAPRAAVRQGNSLVRYTGEAEPIPEPLLLSDPWHCEIGGPNVFLCDDWQWQPDRRGFGSRWFGSAEWQALPRERLRLAAREAAVKEALGLDRSQPLVFRTSFQVQDVASLFLAWEPLDVPCELTLNEAQLQPCPPPYGSDPVWGRADWQWFDLGDAASGTNTLSCTAAWVDDGRVGAARSVVPDAARLVGRFSCGDSDGLAQPSELSLIDGSWHDQALPWYAGYVDYSCWVDAPASWSRCRVFLELAGMRDVAAVWMNGRGCGVRLASPYRFDVTRAILRQAPNELRLRVWNTAAAVLDTARREPVPAGLLGPVRLVAYPLVSLNTRLPSHE